jgi:integrase/recombinase XerC
MPPGWRTSEDRQCPPKSPSVSQRPSPALSAPSVSSVVLEAWLRGRCAQTTKAYGWVLSDLKRFLRVPSEEAAIESFLSAGRFGAKRITVSYKSNLTERKLASATIRQRLSAIRSLVTSAREAGCIEWALDIKSPRRDKCRDMSGPGDDGWRKLRDKARVAALTPDCTKRPRLDRAKRDLALILLMHDRGLRRGECVAMDLKHFRDGTDPKVAVIGKGRTEPELLTIAGPTRDALVDWIKVRGDSPGPLFIRMDPGSEPGVLERLGGDGASRMVKRLGKKAGLSQESRAHGLRHHAITRLFVKTNGNIPEVQAFARHLDPRTTMEYNDQRLDVAGKLARLLADDE